MTGGTVIFPEGASASTIDDAAKSGHRVVYHDNGTNSSDPGWVVLEPGDDRLQPCNVTKHATFVDLTAHIEELLGSEGSHEVADVLAGDLICIGAVTVGDDGYILPSMPEHEWDAHAEKAYGDAWSVTG